MVDEKIEMDYDRSKNRIDFGLWTQQRWSGGKILWEHEHNWGGVHKHKQDSGTRWLQITIIKK